LVDAVLSYAVGGVVVLFCKPFGVNPPGWAQQGVDNVHDTVRVLLNDPALLMDSLMMGVAEVFEDEGIGYAIGYVGFDVAITIATMGKAKTVKIQKLLRSGAKWDDLIRAGAKFDDLIRAGARYDDLIRAGARFDDLVRAGAKVDDLVRIGAKYDDLIRAGARVEDLIPTRLNNWKYRPSNDLYLQNRAIYDNPQFFNQMTGDIIYPGMNGNIHTNGFLNGQSTVQQLQPGMIIDRVGGNDGRFFSPAGTPVEARALPPHTQGQIPNRFEVLVPFDVQAGTVAPWFDQPGMGTQFLTEYNVRELIRLKIIAPIP